jgi:hypothetical protein
MLLSAFRGLVFLLWVAFLPAYVLIGFVPAGSLLMETFHSWFSHSLDNPSLRWGYLVLAALSLGACLLLAWCSGRILQRFAGSSRFVVVTTAVLLPLVVALVPIYGTSFHGPVPLKNAFEAYAQYYRYGSL